MRKPKVKLTAAEKVELKLFTDFKFYAANVLKIRTKQDGIQPFIVNQAQELFLEKMFKQLKETGRVRIVVLKGRQQGLSTLSEGLGYWKTSYSKGFKAMVVAHEDKSSQALFDMTKHYHDAIPNGEPWKQPTKYSNRKELVFSDINSSLTVDTASTEGLGRGQTIQFLHCSELAFWRRSKAAAILSGLMDVVPPDGKDTFVILESTANGMGGVFYDYWKQANEEIDKYGQGKNGFLAVFIPWFIQDEYWEEPIEGFTRTDEEEELAERYGLNDGQLMFRRRKIAEKSKELFMQEYPCCPEEAFLTSGRPVFNLPYLYECLENAPPVKYRMGLEMGPNPSFQVDPRGELYVYHDLNPSDRYTIGADVAEGVKGKLRSNGDYEGDYSVAQVFDSKKRQVAIWRGHVDPEAFAHVLYYLGLYYNEAFMAVEVNNQGILPNTLLERHLYYPNLYVRKDYDKLRDEEINKVGFRTDMETRPLIISELRAAIRDKEIELNDRKTIQELITFVVNPDNLKMEADKGAHDDCVMALAIVNHIHEGVWEPLESLDDYYVDTV